MEKHLFALFASLLASIPTFANDDDVMITRDGSMIIVKIEKISSSQVTFVDLKHKKRGRLNAPADFVYMVMREKGNNIFIDEEGNQMTFPVVKFDKKDDVMFLNNGKMFVIYNVAVGKDEITYQMKDKKKAPRYKSLKSEVFMIRNSDGTNTLYNNSYQERHQMSQQPAQRPSVPQPTQQAIASQPQQSNVQQSVAQAVSSTTTKTQPALVATATVEENFHAAPELSPQEIEVKVNEKNPYTLYRKGSVAEYCFQYKGKQTQYKGGPTYLEQIVYDERIVDGLLVSYIRQKLYNKKHEPSKGIVAAFKDCVFPTEIDTAGTFHLTHNLAQDFMVISKRRGYGVLIPGEMYPGMQLQCNSLIDSAKNLLGGTVMVETAYSNWQVVGEDQITTPAGTFDCVKLTGRLIQKEGRLNAGKQITCWMARGIGFVQYEAIDEASKTNDPFVIYLNRLELK